MRRVVEHIFDKPDDFFSLDKLRRASGLDRRLTVRELIEKAFGHIPRFRTRDEIDRRRISEIPARSETRAGRPASPRCDTISMRTSRTPTFARSSMRAALPTNVNPVFGMRDLKAVPKEWVRRIPEYIKDYVSLNPFLPKARQCSI